jgi:hypothetical protein
MLQGCFTRDRKFGTCLYVVDEHSRHDKYIYIYIYICSLHSYIASIVIEKFVNDTMQTEQTMPRCSVLWLSAAGTVTSSVFVLLSSIFLHTVSMQQSVHTQASTMQAYNIMIELQTG